MNVADIEHFFGALHAKLDDSAVATRRGLERFFNELTPRLERARNEERELDRRLARKFNAFDYLRTDEQGLSKLIADLLDPKGKHGQGDAFLCRFLDLLGTAGFDRLGDLRNGRVHIEFPIKDQRRLDIVVHTDRRCLAIENKPYADDQPDQIKDYLDGLRSHYEEFLLLYLSPQGESPSEDSVRPADLQGEAGKSLRIMPYHHRVKDVWDDDFERTDFGLTHWLRECSVHCDVERLCWFLREAETYCEKKFGSNCADESRRSWVRACLPRWREYQNPRDSAWSRTCLFLQADGFRENWIIGVRSPLPKSSMSDDDRARRTQIERRLAQESKETGQVGAWRAWFEHVDERYCHWNRLTPAMHRELQQGDGEITDYFVGKFKEIAEFATPILDDIEGSRG